MKLTSLFSPWTSFQSLSLWLACSCSYHIFSLCELTILTIHNSPSRPPPAQDLPLSQIFPTIGSFPASGLTPRSLWLDCFFWASRFFVFKKFLYYSFCLVPCGRLSWLFVSFWAQVNNEYRSRITSKARTMQKQEGQHPLTGQCAPPISGGT